MVVWDRGWFFNGPPVKNIGKVFTGHTIVQTPRQSGNVYRIDVGCFCYNNLCIYNITDGAFCGTDSTNNDVLTVPW